jgi:hypothetical protein
MLLTFQYLFAKKKSAFTRSSNSHTNKKYKKFNGYYKSSAFHRKGVLMTFSEYGVELVLSIKEPTE